MEQNDNINNVNILPSTPTYTYAGFWWRFLAYIIDGVIINIILFIPMTIFFSLLSLGMSYSNKGSSRYSIWTVFFVLFTICICLGAIILNFCYFAWFESSKYQATPGKKVLGIIVTDESGYRLSFKRALLRNICKIISGMILDIGYIMAAFTEKNQTLHDILAKTLVLKKV